MYSELAKNNHFCKKTIRGTENDHISTLPKYSSEELNELNEGKITHRQMHILYYEKTCQTMRLPKEVRDTALKREGILEFACGSLKCGCGCGKASYSKVVHY